MNVFVINLASAKGRRESITEQLRERNLPFEIFPAVYGKDLSEMELSKCYNGRASGRIRCRELTRSEIGCALSHIGVYREVVRREIPIALVLEDDVDLGCLNEEVLNALERKLNPNCPNVVLLSQADTGLAYQELGIGKFNLCEFRGGYYAHAYVITQTAAQALIAALYPVKDYADCWERLQQHRVVDLLVLTPPLVMQKQAQFGSSTTEDIRAELAKMGRFQKVWFKVRRAFWSGVDLFLAAYNRRFRPFAGIPQKARSSDRNYGNL